MVLICRLLSVNIRSRVLKVYVSECVLTSGSSQTAPHPTTSRVSTLQVMYIDAFIMYGGYNVVVAVFKIANIIPGTTTSYASCRVAHILLDLHATTPHSAPFALACSSRFDRRPFRERERESLREYDYAGTPGTETGHTHTSDTHTTAALITHPRRPPSHLPSCAHTHTHIKSISNVSLCRPCTRSSSSSSFNHATGASTPRRVRN